MDLENLGKFEIIIGTYEEFLLGYKLDIKNEKLALTQSFADKSHSGALKCVAVQGHLIATGATDDRIFVYNMKTRKQTQIIQTHEGTINTLQFIHGDTHLLSGSDDGQMIATSIKTWSTDANWKKAHSGKPVTNISCHPSGKLALSLGGDQILCTWNLIKGRVAFKTNLKSRTSLGHAPDCLTLSPNGQHFTITGQRIVEIWSMQQADVVRAQKTNAKPVSVCWIDNESILIGLENGKILWMSLDEDEQETQIDAHDARVKSIALYENFIVTISSLGEVKVWQLFRSNKTIRELASANLGCRPTCLALLDLKDCGLQTIEPMETSSSANETTVNKIATTQSSIASRQQLSATERGGIVTIEYENDDEDEELEEQQQQLSDSDMDGNECVPKKSLKRKTMTANQNTAANNEKNVHKSYKKKKFTK